MWRKHGYQRLCFTLNPKFPGKVLIGPAWTNHLWPVGAGYRVTLFKIATSVVILELCVVAVRKVNILCRHSKHLARRPSHSPLGKSCLTLAFFSFLCKLSNISYKAAPALRVSCSRFPVPLPSLISTLPLYGSRHLHPPAPCPAPTAGTEETARHVWSV